VGRGEHEQGEEEHGRSRGGGGARAEEEAGWRRRHRGEGRGGGGGAMGSCETRGWGMPSGVGIGWRFVGDENPKLPLGEDISWDERRATNPKTNPVTDELTRPNVEPLGSHVRVQ
jgi:hypothetical protein